MGLSNIVHVSGRRRSSVGTDWRESSGSALTKGMSDKSLLGKTKAAKAKIMKTTSSVIATLKKPLVKSEEPAPASSPNPKPPPTTGPLIPPVNDASLVTAAPESLIDNDLEPSRLKSVTHVTKTTQGTVLIPVHQTSVPTSHFSLDEQLFLPPDPPAFFYAHWIMTKPKLMFCNPIVFCTIKNQCIQFSKSNAMRLIVSVSTLALHIFALLMFLMLFLLGYNILPFNFAGLPLKITDNTEYLRGLAWTEKKSHDDILDVNTTIIIQWDSL